MLHEQADQVTIRQAQRMVAQLRSTVKNLEQNVKCAAGVGSVVVEPTGSSNSVNSSD